MKCCICDMPIIAITDGLGKVIWDQGNNAEPIKSGRWCDVCNEQEVVPARINLLMKDVLRNQND